MSNVEFEVNESGTHRLMVLEDMVLRAALRFVDLQNAGATTVRERKELLEARIMMDELRAELGKGYQEGEL